MKQEIFEPQDQFSFTKKIKNLIRDGYVIDTASYHYGCGVIVAHKNEKDESIVEYETLDITYYKVKDLKFFIEHSPLMDFPHMLRILDECINNLEKYSKK